MWIVDPLDGTANFLCGLPLFAVNVALVQSGKVVAGVTHLPMMGETFWAEQGGGAWLNGQPIAVSGQSELIRVGARRSAFLLPASPIMTSSWPRWSG